MAGRSGRRGQLPPKDKHMFLKQLEQVSDDESLDTLSLQGAPSKHCGHRRVSLHKHEDTDGCLACGKDDDHNNLMFCDMCDSQYHYYCLDPPLHAVPTGDWFCTGCKPHQKHQAVSTKVEDGLDLMVCALPPHYTERFGEICWAHGGNGFGWWPACIYDPRLTEGSARELARKNLGRRHLVYFFECLMAPFSVLAEGKLVKWEKGLSEDYHLGRTALAHSKTRGNMFRQALHIACLEEGKPIDMRMIWNHQGDEPNVEHIPLSPPVKQSRKKRHRPEEVMSQGKQKAGKRPSREPSNPDSSSPTNLLHTMMTAHSNSPRQVSIEMYCRVTKRGMDASDNEVDESLGFVTLETRTATFLDARSAIQNEMDPDSLPPIEWKFYLPNLGPVSHRQEQRLGPVAAFLQKTFGHRLGDGSVDNPFHLVLVSVKQRN